jgi:hypothetical protein
MATTTDRCGADTFDGSEHRRCSRPASALRDELPVCRQHARLARVSAWSAYRRDGIQVARPATEAEIVGRFTETYRAALYGSAIEMTRGDRRGDEYLRPLLRQYHRDEPVRADFDTYVREIGRTAALALADLGTLSDEAIMAKLRNAVAAA